MIRDRKTVVTSLDKSVLRTILTECRECKRVDDEQMHPPLFGSAVSVDLLGFCNKSMRFTTDGYLLTNLMEKGYAFYIGEDKVQEIAAAVGEENAVPAETPDPAAIGNEELIPE